MINEFKGKYAYLSNFYNAKVKYDGITYLNSEAAFQAQKTLNIKERIKFAHLNPSEAKRLGRQVHLRSDWEIYKERVMYDICKAKFTQNSDLKIKLLSTGNEILIEGNNWGDKEWGCVNGVGLNKLGKILMRIRSELSNV